MPYRERHFLRHENFQRARKKTRRKMLCCSSLAKKCAATTSLSEPFLSLLLLSLSSFFLSARSPAAAQHWRSVLRANKPAPESPRSSEIWEREAPSSAPRPWSLERLLLVRRGMPAMSTTTTHLVRPLLRLLLCPRLPRRRGLSSTLAPSWPTTPPRPTSTGRENGK